jgi:hypothetical protein
MIRISRNPCLKILEFCLRNGRHVRQQLVARAQQSVGEMREGCGRLEIRDGPG